jgi:hypothetical protein
MTSAPVINEALPEEVFGMIFEEHAKLEWKAPVIDGQVCRQWQQTILRNPRAWAHLKVVGNFRSAPSKLHQWLERSGSVPLHIEATKCIPGEEEAVDQHHKRIESIELVCRSNIFAVFKNRSFPILQSLTISNYFYDIPIVRWSAWRAMPELRSLRASNISLDDLPSNAFPQLRVLQVNYCDYTIQNPFHSLTSLMLYRISSQYASESLEFPSLRFLSLYLVKNVKHRVNVPALTTYHELWMGEDESFPMPLPTLVEYGIYGLEMEPPLNVTRLHSHYPNITRLSVRAHPSGIKPFLHSLCGHPTALPMLRILAVDVLGTKECSGQKFSTGDKRSMMNDVFVRNTASSVKMELCFDGRSRVPLYFGHVRVYINEGRGELTSTLRSWMSAFEDLSLFSVCGCLVDQWIIVSTYIVTLARVSFSYMNMY